MLPEFRRLVAEELRKSIRQLCISTLNEYGCKYLDEYRCTDLDGIICMRVEPTTHAKWHDSRQQHIIIKLQDSSASATVWSDAMTSPTCGCGDSDDDLSRQQTKSLLSEVDTNSYGVQCVQSNDCTEAAVNQTLAVKRSCVCVHVNRITDDVADKRLKLQPVDTCDKSQCLQIGSGRAKIKENTMKTANVDPSSPTTLRRQHLGCSALMSYISKNEASTFIDNFSTDEFKSNIRATNHNQKRCGICFDEFRTHVAILEHLRNVHGLEDSFSCITCSEFYPSRTSFVSHRRQHHRDVTLQCWCDVCDVSFTYVEYKQHERECTKAMDRMKYSQHIPMLLDENANYHGVKSRRLSASDDHCSSELVDVSTCERESLRHDDVKVTGVLDASKHCNNAQRLLADCDSDTYEDDDKSRMCDGTFVADGASTMTSSTTYRCQLCPSKSFERFDLFAGHCAETHSRLVCRYCSLSFANKRNLERHVRRHTGETPYSCDRCLQRFYRDDDLRRHKLKHRNK